MFMLFFADVIFCLLFFSDVCQFPFKTRRSHLNDFFILAVYWLLFETLKGPNGFLAFLVPRLGPKNL